MRKTCAVLVMGLGIAVSGARAARDVLPFDWPTSNMQAELVAYLAAAFVPIAPAKARPSLEERMAHPPFVTSGGKVGIDVGAMPPGVAAALRTAAAGKPLTYESFAIAAEKLYAPARAPRRLAELAAQHGIRNGADWVPVDLASALIRGPRRIWFNARTVLESTVAALEAGSARVVYPIGTWFVAEQLTASGALKETHLIGKRDDRDWDFLIYDVNGVQTSQSTELNMRAPFQCFACHRNMARMAPFRDFPAASEAIDGFTPAVRRELGTDGAAIVKRFAIPGTRPDELHGVYGGLAALKAREWVRAGKAPAWVTKLWPRLVKVAPELGRE